MIRKAHQGYFFLFLSLFCLVFSAGCQSSRIIVNNLNEREANEIIVFLAQRGIRATKARSAEGSSGGRAQAEALWNIEVEETNATQAMSLLNEAGLPRRRGQNLLGIFQNTGLVPTELTEKIRYQAGLSDQIASTIRKIDGVLDAEVLLSFPEEDPLNPGSKQGPITASVYIKHSGVFDNPNSQLASKVKRLVSASVSGLNIDNVTLILDRARYGEVPQGALSLPQDKEYVSVWSIHIAKDSLWRFRVVFFGLLLLLLLLFASIVWLVWKTLPLLLKEGFHSLLTLEPFGKEAAAAKVQKEKKEEQESDSTKQEKKATDTSEETETYEDLSEEPDIESEEE
jgi:type III secretion protein J